MSKGVTQSQWLNLVIIIISALVLAFTLIGRFMHKAADEAGARQSIVEDTHQQISEPMMQLMSIDFGTLRISQAKNKDRSKSGVTWSAEPKGAMTQQRIKVLVDRWQKILTLPVTALNQQALTNYSSIATVLLYFADTAQPLVAKVLVSEKNNPTQFIKIRFVSTSQQIIIEDLPLEYLLPQQSEQKLDDEKNFSNPTDLQGSK